MIFKKRHPELRKGEVFLTNIDWPELREDDLDDLRTNWGEIGYSTKRLGEIAYGLNGIPLPGLRPVFVKGAEFKKVQRRLRAGKRSFFARMLPF